MDCKYITRITLGNTIFLLSVLIFLMNEFGVFFVGDFFAKSYLNDLIAPLIILTLTKFLLSFYSKRIYEFSTKQLVFFFSYISIIFEYLLPNLSDRYVADAYDLLAYASGVMLYHFLIKKKAYEIRTDN